MSKWINKTAEEEYFDLLDKYFHIYQELCDTLTTEQLKQLSKLNRMEIKLDYLVKNMYKNH